MHTMWLAGAAWMACTEPPPRIGEGPPSARTATAMVAARALPPDVPIAEHDLQARIVPVNYLPPGTFSEPSELVGRVLREPVYAQEPIVAPMLFPAANEGVAPGHRGVWVRVGEARPEEGQSVEVWWQSEDAEAPCVIVASALVRRIDGDAALLEVEASGTAELAVVARHPSVRLAIRGSAAAERLEEVACSR